MRIRCHGTSSFPKIVALAKQIYEEASSREGTSPFCLDTFRRQYIYGAMSFTAVDADDEPFVVFLAETTACRTTCSGPVLVHPDIFCNMHVLQEVASQAFVRLSELLGLRIMGCVAHPS